MADTYDLEKLTKLNALKQLAERVKENFVTNETFAPVSSGIESLNTNYSTLSGKVTALEEAGGEANKIDAITVNKEAVEPDESKTVDITVPTKTSDIENDSGYKNETEINALITAKIDAFKTEETSDETVNTFKELVDYVATHGAEATEMAGAIDALEALVGETAVSTQITTALAGYVKKDGDKVLSDNNYSAADKAKVDALEYATEEEVTAMLGEVFSAAPVI